MYHYLQKGVEFLRSQYLPHWGSFTSNTGMVHKAGSWPELFVIGKRLLFAKFVSLVAVLISALYYLTFFHFNFFHSNFFDGADLFYFSWIKTLIIYLLSLHIIWAFFVWTYLNYRNRKKPFRFVLSIAAQFAGMAIIETFCFVIVTLFTVDVIFKGLDNQKENFSFNESLACSAAVVCLLLLFVRIVSFDAVIEGLHSKLEPETTSETEILYCILILLWAPLCAWVAASGVIVLASGLDIPVREDWGSAIDSFGALKQVLRAIVDHWAKAGV